MENEGVDFDWYKNEDMSKDTRPQTESLNFQKKFVIMKD
jgi:hypothetical protein